LRRRGCLTTVGIFIALILICCGVLWFVGVPRLRDNIADTLSDELSTQVAGQLEGVSTTTGTKTLNVADLEAELRRNLNTQNVDDIQISVDPGGMTFSFKSNDQEIGYTGTPVAENGKLKLDDMEVNNGFLGFFMPADKLGDAIEKGVNDYFAAQGQEIQSITLGQDEITFEVVNA
jgi:hypothetical protein